jgi:hypothetical protein
MGDLVRNVLKKTPSTEVLEKIKTSLYVDDDSRLRWSKKPHKGQVDDLVGLYIKKNGGHRMCAFSVNGKVSSHLESNVIWFLRTGAWELSTIEHKDGDPTNNDPSNLRLSSHAENMRNTKIRSDNTTGVKGVYRMRKNWQVKIEKDGSVYVAGTYKSFETAKIVRKLAEQRFHGEFARIG